MIRQERIWLITGDPGSGKTTVVSKILLILRTAGYTIGGMLTREVRAHGERQGFQIVDTATEETSVLATTGKGTGPKVGRYRVNLESLSKFSKTALERAARNSDVIVCDEVGPMELYSPEFREAVRVYVLNSKKPAICVIHKRLTDPLIDEFKKRPDSKMFEVTFDNRNSLPQEIAPEIIQNLETL